MVVGSGSSVRVGDAAFAGKALLAGRALVDATGKASKCVVGT